jgi:predicted phosphoribosyltransferase
MLFTDRVEAGRFLASKLREYTDHPEVLVLALPRGGVPVAFEVARELRAPLDDGLATGSTMRAAVAALRQHGPDRIVVAVPVGAPETCEEFRSEADDVVCARTPEPFYAVGLWYGDFSQTTDEEVHDLLDRAAEELAPVHQGRP